MASTWQQTKFPGVRYREHLSRKHGVKKDCYFSIYYRVEKKTREEGLGWSSQGWTAQKAAEVLAELKQNQRISSGPQSLKEKRQLADDLRVAEEAARRKAILENFTFGQLAEKYMDWSKENKKSWREDHSRYSLHLKPALAEIPVREISPFVLERLKRDLLLKKKSLTKGQRSGHKNQNLALSTVRHCLVLVRQMINKAIDWDLYDGLNPVKKIKLPSTTNSRRHRFLTHSEANALLKVLRRSSPQVHDQCLCSLHCGLRFGEIAKLTLADLNFSHGIILIRDPKGESRQAYMTEEIKAMFLSRKPSGTADLIFPSRNGNRQISVSGAYERAVTRLGFNDGVQDIRDKVVFHSLRHTFASWLAIQGTPILTIKELMGHKSIEMTMRYAHLIPDQKHKAVRDMIETFSSSRDTASAYIDNDKQTA